MVEHLFMVLWVVRSIPHDGPIELILVLARSEMWLRGRESAHGAVGCRIGPSWWIH